MTVRKNDSLKQPSDAQPDFWSYVSSPSPLHSKTKHHRHHGLVFSEVYETYWRFAARRQKLFLSRLRNAQMHLDFDDPILDTYRFTNAYRASDRVSQYLIRNVIYDEAARPDQRNIFFRTILFKLFNKIETWEALHQAVGEIDVAHFDYDRFAAVLDRLKASGQTIYSAAYIMPSGGSSFGSKIKHHNHLRLIELMLEERIPERIAQSPTMADAFELMRALPTLGDFLAYQLVTDLNYSPLTNFSEAEFVMPGPGALDGISKCVVDDGGLSPAGIIRYVCDHQEDEFAHFGIEFRNLWGRPLQLIDCQNLFCEISKYARVAHPDVTGVAGRTRIKQKFKPKGRPPAPFYPPKWGINEAVLADLASN